MQYADFVEAVVTVLCSWFDCSKVLSWTVSCQTHSQSQ